MPPLTRGPLGAEVYWRRRLLILGVALLLVLGIARVLGGGSDAADPGAASDPAGQADQAGADASLTPGDPGATAPAGSPVADPANPTPSTKKERRAARKAAKRAAKQVAAAAASASAEAAAAASAAALPDPQGPCADTDVVATSTVPSPVAGNDIAVEVSLHTAFSPACTWTVSSDTLAVKITSGSENIWSSQQCPQAVPTQDVVLRRAVPTTVQVVWSAKRSDEACSGRTDWALPGFYHVLVAALAGEPSDQQFELTAPAAPVVTETAQPDTGAKKSKKG